MRLVQIFVMSILLNISLLAASVDLVLETAIMKALSQEVQKVNGHFIHYDKGAYDWIYVTSDGSFLAKLEGMDPDTKFFIWDSSNIKIDSFSSISIAPDAKTITFGNSSSTHPAASAMADTVQKVAGHFIHYSKEAFDWIFVDSNGQYAAKLQGMNEATGALEWYMLSNVVVSLMNISANGNEVDFSGTGFSSSSASSSGSQIPSNCEFTQTFQGKTLRVDADSSGQIKYVCTDSADSGLYYYNDSSNNMTIKQITYTETIDSVCINGLWVKGSRVADYQNGTMTYNITTNEGSANCTEHYSSPLPHAFMPFIEDNTFNYMLDDWENEENLISNNCPEWFYGEDETEIDYLQCTLTMKRESIFTDVQNSSHTVSVTSSIQNAN